MKPSVVNVLGKEYKIEYCEKPSDVDIYKRQSLWGQVDYWTHTIRIYDGLQDNDTLQTLMHEILHVITTELKMVEITRHDKEEDIIDLLALALADVMKRNDWIK